jgi:hypothetical protein
MHKSKSQDVPKAPAAADHRPLEFSPYTPEQLALGSLPLTKAANGPVVPQPLNRLLREYQREGVQFMYDRWAAGKGAILGDDMGLGKTIQGQSGPHLLAHDWTGCGTNLTCCSICTVISFLSAIMGKTGLRSVDDLRRHKRFRQLTSEGKFRPGIVASNPAPGSEWVSGRGGRQRTRLPTAR